MNHLIYHIEENDPKQMHLAAAYIRSAWEDLHQARRHHMARNQPQALQRRQDDTHARLLTDEEEAKLREDVRIMKANDAPASSIPRMSHGHKCT